MSSVCLAVIFALTKIFVMDCPYRGFDIGKALGFAKVYSVSNNIDHVSKVIELRAVPTGTGSQFWNALYVMTTNNVMSTNNCSYCGVNFFQDGSVGNEKYFNARFTKTPSLTMEKVVDHYRKRFGDGSGISYVKYVSFVENEPVWLVYSTNGVYKLEDDYKMLD